MRPATSTTLTSPIFFVFKLAFTELPPSERPAQGHAQLLAVAGTRDQTPRVLRQHSAAHPATRVRTISPGISLCKNYYRGHGGRQDALRLAGPKLGRLVLLAGLKLNEFSFTPQLGQQLTSSQSAVPAEPQVCLLCALGVSAVKFVDRFGEELTSEGLRMKRRRNSGEPVQRAEVLEEANSRLRSIRLMMSLSIFGRRLTPCDGIKSFFSR